MHSTAVGWGWRAKCIGIGLALLRSIGAFTLLAIWSSTVRAEGFDTWSASSPDKQFLAVERRIPNAEFPSRLDLDGTVVFICALKEGTQRAVVAKHTFPGRVVSKIKWSPDSRFLLFTTASAGGHSAWKFETFVFCVTDRSFRAIENAAGGWIGAPEFQWEAPDVALLKVYEPSQDALSPIKLSLGETMGRMVRLQ